MRTFKQFLYFNIMLKYRRFFIKPISKKYLINKQGLKEYNMSEDDFNLNKRKFGISGFARLKNADEFLEPVLEAYIKYLDEIILVNNNSTDNTEYICKKIKKKYPKKIHYYSYKPIVYPARSEEHKKEPVNSVNSLVYYYNFALSKTHYQYAFKIDDDNYPIEEQLKEIVKHIKQNKSNTFIITPGINLLKKNNKIGICKKFPYCGLNGDMGFFRVCEKTYFYHTKNHETLNIPYKLQKWSLFFIHLKYLQKDFGAFSHSKKWGNFLKKKLENSDIIPLDNDLENYIKKLDFL